MPNIVAGKVAIVTGAGRGIGRGIARLMASFDSSVPDLLVTRPSTASRPFGSRLSGSKPPARSVSYSMK